LLTGSARRRAEDLLLQALQWLEGDRSRELFGLVGFPAVMARGYLTWVLADRGEFNEGIAHGQEGIRLAGRPITPLAWSPRAGCSPISRSPGRPQPRRRLLERGLALGREWNLTPLSVMATGSLGYAYALSGRVAEGIPVAGARGECH